MPSLSEPWYKRELTGRKLLWNIFFYGSHTFLFIYGWWKQAADPRLAALNGLKFSVWISRGAGLCLGYDGALILLPVCRNLLRIARPAISWLVPVDEAIFFHRQIAYSILFFTITHTTAHYVNFINVERTQVRPETAWEIHYAQPGGFTGHVMLVLMFFMYTTAHKSIRNQCFEAFWYTHHLAFFFMLGLYTHATGCFVRGALPDTPTQCLGYGTVDVTIWGGIIYFIERVIRVWRSSRQTKMTGVLMHPSGAMEIRFQKPSFKYKAGQWLFLSVPEVSKWQWHPFTISSAPDDPYVSVHIRQAGDFTMALGERLGCTASLAAQLSEQSKKGILSQDSALGEFTDVSGAMGRPLPSLKIDGPFGAPAEDVFNYEVMVLIGAGIGVTPFASILKNIWYMQQKNKLGALRRVEFIWINKDSGSFEWFQSMLKDLEAASSDNFLRISSYLTGKLSQDEIANISINDAGAEFDALTQLKSRTHFGRPDWTSIFASIRSGIESGQYLPGRESSLKTRVGTFFCGPAPLARELKLQTKHASTPSVTFNFRKEHF